MRETLYSPVRACRDGCYRFAVILLSGLMCKQCIMSSIYKDPMVIPMGGWEHGGDYCIWHAMYDVKQNVKYKKKSRNENNKLKAR